MKIFFILLFLINTVFSMELTDDAKINFCIKQANHSIISLKTYCEHNKIGNCDFFNLNNEKLYEHCKNLSAKVSKEKIEKYLIKQNKYLTYMLSKQRNIND